MKFNSLNQEGTMNVKPNYTIMPRSKEPINCPQCDKECKGKFGLQAHTRLAHKNIKKMIPQEDAEATPKVDVYVEKKVVTKEPGHMHDICWSIHKHLRDGQERAIVLSFLNDCRTVETCLNEMLHRLKTGESRAIVNNYLHLNTKDAKD